MPDSSRIFLCRAGFVLFCVVPTFVTGLWIVHRSSSDYTVAQKAEWERELTSRLGFSVEIASVSYPNPSTALLENVRLLDPETRAVAAQVSGIEISPDENGWQATCWQPQVEAAQLGKLARTLHDRLLLAPADQLSTRQITAHELTLLAGQQGQSLTNMVCRLEPAASGPQLTLEFHLPGEPAQPGAPAKLAMIRRREQSPPATEWQLDTAGQSLPCALFADVLPPLAHLGRDCRFLGTVTWLDSQSGPAGELAGTLAPLDFDALVTEQFPHQLSGLALARIERGVISGGKLVELRGTLQAQNGTVSQSLLAAAQEHLQLPAPGIQSSANQTASIPFRQLSLGFHLDGRVLRLTGSADPIRPGVLLANAAGPVLESPSQHQAAAVNLLRALLPENQYQVPATRQTDALVGLFPLPDLAPTRTAALPTHTPTRLAPSAGNSTPAIRQPGLR